MRGFCDLIGLVESKSKIDRDGTTKRMGMK